METNTIKEIEKNVDFCKEQIKIIKKNISELLNYLYEHKNTIERDKKAVDELIREYQIRNRFQENYIINIKNNLDNDTKEIIQMIETNIEDFMKLNALTENLERFLDKDNAYNLLIFATRTKKNEKKRRNKSFKCS